MFRVSTGSASLKGEIQLPFSKSESNRALVIQHLTSAPFVINNLSDSDDTIILQELLDSNEEVLDCGMGGTTFRFLLAYLSLKGEKKIITGSDRLLDRPVNHLVNALNALGGNLSYIDRKGFLPVRVGKGDFQKANKINITGAVSSQFISALLMIAPLLPNGLDLTITGKILSLPYIQLTLSIMEYFGIRHSFINNKIFIAPQSYHAKDFTVCRDWSAASYFYEAAAVANDADLFFKGLDFASAQGDKIIAEIMQHFNIKTIAEKEGIRIIKAHKSQLATFEYDFISCPDLAQTLAFTCAAMGMETKLSGLDNLVYKETNRITALAKEITKMGSVVETRRTEIEIYSNSNPSFQNRLFQTYNDHRMVMAIAPLALKTPLFLESLSDVSKSFISYWNELGKLGFVVNG